MCDDLISRKAVIDYLREQNNNVIIEKHKDGFISEDACRGMESAISAFRNFILTLPTAFDKEKVLEKLKKHADIALETDDAYGSEVAFGEWSAYKQTEEIVKKGGIE